MRGVAVVELTIIIFAVWLFIPLVYFVGRILYDYTVLRQAAADAALYLSTVPQVEYKTPAGGAAVALRAERIIRNTIEAAAIEPDAELLLQIRCDNAACGSGVPVDVGVSVTYNQDFTGFLTFYLRWIPEGHSWRFLVVSTVPYTR
jgi:hypothetical protein